MINPKVKYNKTKIIATLGPATDNKSMIKKLILAGVDVFRINFSHGDLETHKKTLELIRTANKELGTSIAILGDLQGPKLRIGKVEGNQMRLVRGQELKLASNATISKDGLIHVIYPGMGKDLKPGEPILLDDGKIELRVTRIVNRENVMAKVINGGILSSNKGFNLPDSNLSVESMTPKDRKDALFAIENEFDWIALSFVRDAGDIAKLRGILNRHKSDARVIAKVEKPQAVKNLESIIEVSDAIMVARGDLGVELPMEKVPIIQKTAVDLCLDANKPVIIATQMMESMIENPTPTRAEANDVANAVMDGADAVMLSAETSIGKYPLQAVQAVERILGSTEKGWEAIYHKMQKPNPSSKTFYSDEICYTAVSMSYNIGAKAIISMTQTGYTAFKIASNRPNCNVFIFTSNKRLLTQLSLVWNVRVFYYDKRSNTDETVNDVIKILKKVKELKVGDIVINTAAMPAFERRKTNTLKITRVR